MSGGLTAELTSHQVDVSDWMFGSSPEFVIGLGSLDILKDGRNVYDNIQLIYKYPKGPKGVDDPAFAELLAKHRTSPRKISPEEITDRLFLPMLTEAGRVLEEGLVRTISWYRDHLSS